MTRRVIADRRAGVAVLFALAAALLVLVVGVAVDATRLWMVRVKLQQSVDAAALLAALRVGETTQTEEARRLFWVNFSTRPYGDTIGYLGATSTGAAVKQEDAAHVRVSAKADLPLLFGPVMRLFGGDGGAVSVASGDTIARRGDAYEIALVLDITSTMTLATSDGTTRVQGMKDAVADLLDVIYGPADTVQNLSISVVPFRTSVNIGTHNRPWVDDTAYAAADWSVQPWRGCVEARQNGYDLTEDNPTTKPFKPLFWKTTYRMHPYQACTSTGCTTQYYLGDNDWHSGYVTDTGNGGAKPAHSNLPVGPNLGCPNQALLPLTESKSAVGARVASLVATGGIGTVTAQGLQWGWLTLSPLWQGHWGLAPARDGAARPRAYSDTTARKVLVLMSDGQSGWGGNHNCSPDKVWPACLQTDGYYTAYGRLSANHLGVAMPSGTPPDSSKNASARAATALNARAVQTCTQIKTKGVEIYVVAFDAPPGSADEALLKGCATDAAHYFNATDGAGIRRAFTAIGRRIGNLRLTQ